MNKIKEFQILPASPGRLFGGSYEGVVVALGEDGFLYFMPFNQTEWVKLKALPSLIDGDIDS